MLNLEKPKCQNEGDWTDAQAATPLRVTTFGALYLAHGTRDLGMPFHAEVSFMDGVEEAYQTPEEQKRARVNVPPTATWIFLAGEEIHELCRINYHRIADMSPYSKSLWKGGNGYSLERWA